jgi:hypothetical protein
MKMYMTIEEVAQSLRVTVPTVRWLRQRPPPSDLSCRLRWPTAE